MNTAAKWPALPSPAVRLTLLIGIPIAALAPFDVLFSALTLGSPSLRMMWIAALVLIGARAGAGTGLRLEGHGARHPVLIGLAAAIVVAAYLLVLDCFVFRSLLDPNYAAFMHRPLGERLVYFMPRAFNENIMYRLFGFGGLVWLLSRGGRVPVSGWMLAAAMIGAQLVNVYFNVVMLTPGPVTPIVLLYDALRFVAPGVLSAVIYLRYGFTTAEIASVSCHAVLQPGFSVFF